MRMLKWMCSKIKKDKIRNWRFREHLVVASIGNKIRETHLRWLRHVQHWLAMALMREILAMQVDGPPRGKGRPKSTKMEAMQIDLKISK